jgi:hypothetical protein
VYCFGVTRWGGEGRGAESKVVSRLSSAGDVGPREEKTEDKFKRLRSCKAKVLEDPKIAMKIFLALM